MPMQTNQLVKGSGQKPLQVNPSKDLSGDIYLSHREFVGNVQAGFTNSTASTITKGTSIQSSFQVTPYAINAALYDSFPWLAQVAQNFTMYEFIGLVFEYRPTSGEYGNTSTNALGKVVMATQYDPDAPSFGSSVQMENYDYATACKPSEHMLHGVETKSSQRYSNMLYTRNGVSAKDKILTDVGLFQIATEGVPMTLAADLAATQTQLVNIGELWVTYKVKLSRANLFGSYLSNNVQMDVFTGQSLSSGTLSDNTASYLGSGGKVWGPKFTYNSGYLAYKNTNTIGCQVQTTNMKDLTITFPTSVTSGIYRIEAFIAYGTGLQNYWIKPGSLNNCTNAVALGMISTAAGINVSPFTSTATTTTEQAIVAYVQINAPGLLVASCVLSLALAVTSSAVTSVTISQCPGGIIS